MSFFHHVLRDSSTTDEDGRPLFIPIDPDAEWEYDPRNYRVVPSEIALGDELCVITPDGERCCNVGIDHPHGVRHWADPRYVLPHEGGAV